MDHLVPGMGVVGEVVPRRDGLRPDRDRTGRPDTEANESTISSTLVPRPVPRLNTCRPGRPLACSSAARCPAARSSTWM